MREERVNRWVQELIGRHGFMRRLQYIPKRFYTELTDEERAEVMRRYRDERRKFPPFTETK